MSNQFSLRLQMPKKRRLGQGIEDQTASILSTNQAHRLHLKVGLRK